MATVIDALLVTLGLDASKYKAQHEEARKTLDKTKDAATKADADSKKRDRDGREAAKKTAAEMEARGKQVAQTFSKIRNEVVGLLALFTAGRGAADFVRDITLGDAAAGHLAENLGIATDELQAWEGAATRAGGSAAGLDGSFQSLQNAIQQFSITGQSSLMPYLRAMGVSLADPVTGKAKQLPQLLMDISRAVQGMDRQHALTLLSGLPLDAGTKNLLLQGPAAIQKMLDEQKKLGVANDGDAKNAQNLLIQFQNLSQAVTGFVRAIINDLSPSLTEMLGKLTAWIEANGPRIKAELTNRIEAFIKTLEGYDWAGLVAKISAIADSANGVAEALGGWTHILEGFFALWAISRVAKVVAAIGLIRSALMGVSAVGNVAPASGGLLSWLLRLAPLALTGPAGGEDPEFSKRKNDEYLQAHPSGSSPVGTWLQQHLPSWMTGGGSQRLPSEQQSARAEEARSYFESQGWTRQQAAGLIANIEKESGFNEKAVGDGGAAHGIAQWHGDREAEFVKQFGHSLAQSTYQEQLKFMNYELTQGKEKTAGAALRAAKTGQDAAAVVSRQYERPGDADGEAQRRGFSGAVWDLRFQTPKQPAPPSVATAPATGATPAIQPSAFVPNAGQRWGATNNSTNTSNSSETHFNGPVNINTQARDGQGIASAFRDGMMGWGLVPQANTGLA